MIITGKKFSKPAMSRVINGDVQLDAAPEKPVKYRLDHQLVKAHPEFNRSTLQNFIKSGQVTVNGIVVKKPNAKIPPDAKLQLTVPAKSATVIEPTPIYQDQNVLVLNKPAGLLSMAKGEFCAESTLEDYGLLVHRLDRDTSGVVILAKTPAVQKALRRQFQERKVHKTYYAVVVGHPKLNEAMIDLPIARNLKRPTTFQVNPSGKPAQTHYKVIKSNQKYSLLELKPITGRTHQLRVHLHYLDTPILGDRVYGVAADRLYLHAASLEITIPEGNRQIFSAPLPQEFNSVLQ